MNLEYDTKRVCRQMRCFFQRLTDIYLACMLGAFLIFPGFGGYAQITTHKSMAYLVLSGAYFLIVVVGRLELALVGGAPWPRPVQIWKRLHLSQKLIILLWGITILSTIFAVDRTTAILGGSHWEGILTLSLYYGCFLLVSYLAKPKLWMLGVFAAAISINCVISLLQFAGWNPLNLYPEGATYYDAGRRYIGRMLGTIGNVNLQGALFSLAIPAFWIAVVKGERKRRFLLLLPLALCLIVLLKINIDAGLVGVFGGLFLTLPILPKMQIWRKRFFALMLVGSVLLFAGLYFFEDFMSGFLWEASELLHGRGDDSFGSGRLGIWRKTLELVPERWLLGGGPDTLGLRLDDGTRLYSSKLNVAILLSADMAHNEYLNILVNQGLPALLLDLAALGAGAVSWIKAAPTNPTAAVCGGALLSYGIQAFFGISTPITAPYFWLSLALLISSVSNKEEIDYETYRTSDDLSQSGFGDDSGSGSCCPGRRKSG